MADKEAESKNENESKRNDEMALSKEEIAVLKTQVSELETRNKEFEKLLVDPNYIEFLTSKGEKKDSSEGKKEVDFENLTKKELFELTLKTVGEVLKKSLTPISEDVRLQAAATDIKEAMARHPDFIDYKEEMMELSRRHTTMNAEEVYQLAKAGGPPKKPTKPAPKVSSGEAPSNISGGSKQGKIAFDKAFDNVWREKVGQKETI